jgi:Ala-tRNA(Pro) deacylase
METKLYADLQALDIPYDVVEHPAVFTVEESRAVDGDIPGAHTKNLFLKDAGGRFWLITVPAALRADLKALPAVMGAKRVSFGKGEDMERLIGVTPGSVTPLGAIADAAGAVTIVLDASLASADRVNCHPMRNTATLGLSGADLVRALTHWGHPPVIVDVPAQD